MTVVSHHVAGGNALVTVRDLMARQGRPASGRRSRSTGTVSVTDLLRREQPAKAVAIEETAVLPSDLAWLLRDDKTWAQDSRPEFEPVTGSLAAIAGPAEQTSTDLPVIPLGQAPAEESDRKDGRKLALLGVGPRMFGVALLAAIGAGTWVAGSAAGGTTLTGEAAPAPQAQPAPHGTGATTREAGAPLAAMAAPAPAAPAAAPAKPVTKPAPRRPVVKPAPRATPAPPPVAAAPIAQPPSFDYEQYAQQWEQYYYANGGDYSGDYRDGGYGNHDSGSHGKHHHHR